MAHQESKHQHQQQIPPTVQQAPQGSMMRQPVYSVSFYGSGSNPSPVTSTISQPACVSATAAVANTPVTAPITAQVTGAPLQQSANDLAQQQTALNTPVHPVAQMHSSASMQMLPQAIDAAAQKTRMQQPPQQMTATKPGDSTPRQQLQPSVSSSLQRLAAANEETWIQLGKLAELMKQEDKGLTYYENALRHNPYSIPALTGYAFLLRNKEQFPKAIEYLQSILNLDSKCGEVWSALGHCYLMMDELQKAYSAYQQALYHLRDPKEPNLWYGIGILYDRYGSLEHAEEAFSQALRIDPNFEKANEIYFRLGIICKQQQKYAQALKCFSYILKNPPKPLNETDIWFQVGHVHEQQKDYTMAKEAYERVLADNPTHAKVLQQLGWLYHQKAWTDANQDLAIQYLTKSLKSDPQDAQSWYLLGRCHMAQQKYYMAYEAYQQAVYWDSRNPIFWCSIGVLYYQIDQYRDALDAYSRAIRLNPYISEVWYDLGTLYESCNNQINDALDAYQRAAELDPSNPHIKTRLQFLQQELRNSKENGTPNGPNANNNNLNNGNTVKADMPSRSLVGPADFTQQQQQQQHHPQVQQQIQQPRRSNQLPFDQPQQLQPQAKAAGPTGPRDYFPGGPDGAKNANTASGYVNPMPPPEELNRYMAKSSVFSSSVLQNDGAPDNRSNPTSGSQGYKHLQIESQSSYSMSKSLRHVQNSDVHHDWKTLPPLEAGMTVSSQARSPSNLGPNTNNGQSIPSISAQIPASVTRTISENNGLNTEPQHTAYGQHPRHRMIEESPQFNANQAFNRPQQILSQAPQRQRHDQQALSHSEERHAQTSTSEIKSSIPPLQPFKPNLMNIQPASHIISTNDQMRHLSSTQKQSNDQSQLPSVSATVIKTPDVGNASEAEINIAESKSQVGTTTDFECDSNEGLLPSSSVAASISKLQQDSAAQYEQTEKIPGQEADERLSRTDSSGTKEKSDTAMSNAQDQESQQSGKRMADNATLDNEQASKRTRLEQIQDENLPEGKQFSKLIDKGSTEQTAKSAEDLNDRVTEEQISRSRDIHIDEDYDDDDDDEKEITHSKELKQESANEGDLKPHWLGKSAGKVVESGSSRKGAFSAIQND